MAWINKRTKKSGATVYEATVRVKGHPALFQKFAIRRDAERWANRMESDIRSGVYIPPAEARKTLFNDIIERYSREVVPLKKSGDSRVPHLKFWAEHLGQYYLSGITPALIAEKRDLLLNPPEKSAAAVSPVTSNRYMATLKHVFSTCVKEWHLIRENPANQVRMKPESRGRLRYLSCEERQRLVEACRASDDNHVLPAVLIALATGMRRGEILRLHWEHVDLTNGVLLIEDSKNGERRRATLSGCPLDVLRNFAKVRQLNSPLVFPHKTEPASGKPHNFRKSWEKAAKAAGLQDFRFHDLRHTCASMLAENGASLLEIGEVLGHKTPAMTKRYAHLTASHTAQVLEGMVKKAFG